MVRQAATGWREMVEWQSLLSFHFILDSSPGHGSNKLGKKISKCSSQNIRYVVWHFLGLHQVCTQFDMQTRLYSWSDVLLIKKKRFFNKKNSSCLSFILNISAPSSRKVMTSMKNGSLWGYFSLSSLTPSRDVGKASPTPQTMPSQRKICKSVPFPQHHPEIPTRLVTPSCGLAHSWGIFVHKSLCTSHHRHLCKMKVQSISSLVLSWCFALKGGQVYVVGFT